MTIARYVDSITRYLATKKGLVSVLATSNYNFSDYYKQIKFGMRGGTKGLEDVQRRDRIKAHFAQANGLHLITIPYTDYDRIGTIIIDRLTEVAGESPLTFVRKQ